MNSIFQFFKPLSFVTVYNKYNPDTSYVWIAFNDNSSIVYSDGKKIVYEE